MTYPVSGPNIYRINRLRIDSLFNWRRWILFDGLRWLGNERRRTSNTMIKERWTLFINRFPWFPTKALFFVYANSSAEFVGLSVYLFIELSNNIYTSHTHRHTHIYIYIYNIFVLITHTHIHIYVVGVKQTKQNMRKEGECRGLYLHTYLHMYLHTYISTNFYFDI